ncbi:MAG TPA: aminotransferase class I/II-fold pyridoxal phosphate-dependent enzyme [Thermoanaerobaculia bacterium]|nr:aminotransferase class I/II-fold pyridoxal phosphate-dependent enzyme [Thermoanaerobaculia bacterium]
MSRLYLSPPHMSGRELELLTEAFESNWIAPLGPHVDGFEEELAARCGVGHAAALSSGTAALHLALLLAGVGPGDEVWVSDLTFAASANAVVYVGATPVFVDADRDTWTLDPALLAEGLADAARRDRLPKALIPVDLYGQCCDYRPIEAACAEHGVTLIEDSAEALGATYDGRPAGSFGRFGVMSFNGNKILTTSGGGALLGDDAEEIARARKLASQAREPAPHYEHHEVGYNYRLSNLLAAVGRGQLEVLDERVAARRGNCARYQELLDDLPGIDFMPEASYGRSNRWLTVVTIDPAAFGADREAVRLALEAENVEARPVWKPMHLQPVFAGCRVLGGRVGEELFERGLCLPSGSAMTDADLERVAELVRAIGRG